MDAESVERALKALYRFKALSTQARASTVYRPGDGSGARCVERSRFHPPCRNHPRSQKVRVLTGEEEAYFSALGIVSGYHDPDGIVGDLGGGSLELIDVRRTRDRQGRDPAARRHPPVRTCPRARSSRRAHMCAVTCATSPSLKNAAGRTFYAVGGTWRSIAKLHMELRDYPLHMMQGYEISFEETMAFLDEVIEPKDTKAPAYAAISKSRRNLLPFGAIAMQEVIALMKPARISFSALGVREGYLFSLLSDQERSRDPLLTAAGELAILRARSPEHARELADWTGRMVLLLRYHRDGGGKPLPAGGLSAGRYQLARASGLPRPAGAEHHRPQHLLRHHPCRSCLYRAGQLLPVRGPAR